jgi:hypothetical protein
MTGTDLCVNKPHKSRLYLNHLVFYCFNIVLCGSGSSVGIATELPGCTVRGSNPGGGEIFRTCPDRSLGPNQPPVEWVPGLSRG